MTTPRNKSKPVPSTARVLYKVRTPTIAALEGVLQGMADDGWLLLKHSEPIKSSKGGVCFVLTYHKAVMVKGKEAERLMAARKGLGT